MSNLKQFELISMVKFISYVKGKMDRNNYPDKPFNEILSIRANLIDSIFKYSKLLEQVLELWMFVPCILIDGKWVVLKEPPNYELFITGHFEGIKRDAPNTIEPCEQYQQAKERVLFSGVNISVGNGLKQLIFRSKRVEHLISDSVNLDLTLTETGIKQIGLIK